MKMNCKYESIFNGNEIGNSNDENIFTYSYSVIA